MSRIVGPGQSRQRPLQGGGDRSQRYSQHSGDVAVSQPFGAERKTALILFGQRAYNGQQPLLSL
jgi:hypothetical protein